MQTSANFIYYLLLFNVCWRDENKQKTLWMAHFKNVFCYRSQAELQFLYINPHKGDDWTRTFKEQDGVAIISIIFSSTNKTDLRNSTAYMVSFYVEFYEL